MSLSHLTLSSGRWIRLIELRMSMTYGGMLEGHPCRRINDGIIDRFRQRTEKEFSYAPVHLVPPSREYPDEAGSAFGPVEVLPSVECVGVFDSREINPGFDGSRLVVAWFQATPDLPSDKNADVALRDIRWEELAEDYEF